MAVQLDDMNPGISLTGLFWTMALPEESLEVDFDALLGKSHRPEKPRQ